MDLTILFLRVTGVTLSTHFRSMFPVYSLRVQKRNIVLKCVRHTFYIIQVTDLSLFKHQFTAFIVEINKQIHLGFFPVLISPVAFCFLALYLIFVVNLFLLIPEIKMLDLLSFTGADKRKNTHRYLTNE